MRAYLQRGPGSPASTFTLPTGVTRFPDVILLGDLAYVLRVTGRHGGSGEPEATYYPGDALRLFEGDAD